MTTLLTDPNASASIPGMERAIASLEQRLAAARRDVEAAHDALAVARDARSTLARAIALGQPHDGGLDDRDAAVTHAERTAARADEVAAVISAELAAANARLVAAHEAARRDRLRQHAEARERAGAAIDQALRLLTEGVRALCAADRLCVEVSPAAQVRKHTEMDGAVNIPAAIRGALALGGLEHLATGKEREAREHGPFRVFDAGYILQLDAEGAR
jgi:hypothetical protein